ncbi:hypothetical protein C8R45DRAFT_1002479 [Mycena sanguinolenta]|nr:hypothetical protein C8R45DRAFT_1002479 [Mycena sanguinolenta]
MQRNKIDREINRLKELKADCYEQFALFSAARTEGKADRIVDTTSRIDVTAGQILDNTTRIEGTAAQIVDTTGRIEIQTGQIIDATARVEMGNAQLADTAARTEDNTRQNMYTAARIEVGNGLIADTTSRIEQATNHVHVLELKKVLEEWLGHPPGMTMKQDNMQELQHKGTGIWFLGGAQFKDWKETPGSLWIRGNSGTGKSVLR